MSKSPLIRSAIFLPAHELKSADCCASVQEKGVFWFLFCGEEVFNLCSPPALLSVIFFLFPEMTLKFKHWVCVAEAS